jgi:hypothetical protein
MSVKCVYLRSGTTRWPPWYSDQRYPNGPLAFLLTIGFLPYYWNRCCVHLLWEYGVTIFKPNKIIVVVWGHMFVKSNLHQQMDQHFLQQQVRAIDATNSDGVLHWWKTFFVLWPHGLYTNSHNIPGGFWYDNRTNLDTSMTIQQSHNKDDTKRFVVIGDQSLQGRERWHARFKCSLHVIVTGYQRKSLVWHSGILWSNSTILQCGSTGSVLFVREICSSRSRAGNFRFSSHLDPCQS